MKINLASGRYAEPIAFPMGFCDYNPPTEPRRRKSGASHESSWPSYTNYRKEAYNRRPGAYGRSDTVQTIQKYSCRDETGYSLDPEILAQAESSAPDDYEYPEMLGGLYWVIAVRRRAARRRKKEEEETSRK